MFREEELESPTNIGKAGRDVPGLQSLQF
jgi:hypothetical protein